MFGNISAPPVSLDASYTIAQLTALPGITGLSSGIDAVMATPATVSSQPGSYSGYTKQWPSDNTTNAAWVGVAEFYGGFPARATNRVRPRSSTSNPATATSPLSVTGFNDGISICAFWTDEPAFAVQINTSNTLPFRFRVNGQYVSLTGTVAAQTADCWMLVDLSSASVTSPYYVEIEGPNSWGIQRIATRPTRSVWSPMSVRPRIMVLGDSFVAGPLSGQYTSPTPITQDGWARQMAKLLNCPDTWVSGLGGTGWATSNGTSPAMPDRAYDALNLMPDGTTERTSWRPDVIVATCGLNDVGKTVSTVTDGVQAFYNYIRNRSGLTPIIFGGVHWKPSGGNLASTQALEAAIRAKVQAIQAQDANVGFVPISETAALQWVFGTGYEGATNASGNSDVYSGTDGVHPSRAGHYFYAMRYATEVIRVASAMIR